MISLYGSHAGTQFIFDKVYANRYEMDKNCRNDNVILGRYVLVSYEQSNEKGDYYFSNLLTSEENAVITNNIQDNLAKDIAEYKNTDNLSLWNGVGWNNTVWQKQFINDDYKYVKIADLNSFNFNTIDCGNSVFNNNYLRLSRGIKQLTQIPIEYNFVNNNTSTILNLTKNAYEGYIYDDRVIFPIKINSKEYIYKNSTGTNGFWNLAYSDGVLNISSKNAVRNNASITIYVIEKEEV